MTKSAKSDSPVYEAYNCPNCDCEWKYDPRAGPKMAKAAKIGARIVNFMIWPGLINPVNRQLPAVGCDCAGCGYQLQANDLEDKIVPAVA